MRFKIIIACIGLILAVSVVTLFITAEKSSEVALTQANKQNQSGITAPTVLSNETTSVTDLPVLVEKKKVEAKSINNPTSSSVDQAKTSSESLALLANGCFWCVEADLEKVAGVSKVVSGYAGGTLENPTYENYITGGHREVVLVTYDPTKVTYANLVEHIIKNGDPTDAAGSFNDRGPQYAPAIYFGNELEKAEARRVIEAIDAMKLFQPLPLIVIPTVKFWPAEEYHQNFAKKNPLKYGYYRTGSGRTEFINKTWGDRALKFEVPASVNNAMNKTSHLVTKFSAMSWNSFMKPSKVELQKILTPLQYKVTQEDGTESAFKNEYDKNYEEGIYVDIVSGEPLYFSKDKYDSGTGWPSFVQPISLDVVNLKEDNAFFSKRTEVRSRYADSHIGHVFDDGPSDRGGKRYCMNSAALRFIPKINMEQEGYGYLLPQI